MTELIRLLFQFIARFLSSGLQLIGKETLVSYCPWSQFSKGIDPGILVPLGRHRLDYFERLETILEERELIVAIVDESVGGHNTGGSAYFNVVHEEPGAGWIGHDRHASENTPCAQKEQ